MVLPSSTSNVVWVLVISDGRIVADDKPNNLSQRLSGTERIELGVSGSKSTDIISKISSETYKYFNTIDNSSEFGQGLTQTINY